MATIPRQQKGNPVASGDRNMQAQRPRCGQSACPDQSSARSNACPGPSVMSQHRLPLGETESPPGLYEPTARLLESAPAAACPHHSWALLRRRPPRRGWARCQAHYAVSMTCSATLLWRTKRARRRSGGDDLFIPPAGRPVPPTSRHINRGGRLAKPLRRCSGSSSSPA